MSLNATLTDFAREMDAIALAEPIILGDWSAKVGTGGLDLTDPLATLPINRAASDLIAPVGGARALGRVLTTGTGATATALTNGEVSLANVTSQGSPRAKWFRVTTGALQGTWEVRRWLSSTEAVIYAPLFTGSASVNWELRDRVVIRLSATATAFHLHIPSASDNITTFGEIGVFGRVLYAPSRPSLVGQPFLLALAHHPAKVKASDVTLNHYLAVQR